MLLLCTPNSLYSRIIRIAAIELDVELPFEFVGVRDGADKLLKYNPAGKVPTLVLDDGSVLAESRPICEFLEARTNKNLLADIADLQGRGFEGIVSGFVDGIAVWVREARRAQEDQSSAILELESKRAYRCLHTFERFDLPASQLNYALISLFSALELMSMRVDDSWKLDFPNLTAWYSTLAELEQFLTTRPEITPT